MPGMIKDRYSTYSEGVGKRIRDGKVRQLLLSRNPSLILQPCQRAAHHISASDSPQYCQTHRRNSHANQSFTTRATASLAASLSGSHSAQQLLLHSILGLDM